jgi:hypothetical protein
MQNYGIMESLLTSKLLTLTRSAYQLEADLHEETPVAARGRGKDLERRMNRATNGIRTDVTK